MTTASSMPINKVSFGTLAGLVLTVVFLVLRRYTAVNIDPELQGAITILVGSAVAYMTPIAPGEVKAVGNPHATWEKDDAPYG